MNGDDKLDYREFKQMMFTHRKDSQDDQAGASASSKAIEASAAAKRFGCTPPQPPPRSGSIKAAPAPPTSLV